MTTEFDIYYDTIKFRVEAKVDFGDPPVLHGNPDFRHDGRGRAIEEIKMIYIIEGKDLKDGEKTVYSIPQKRVEMPSLFVEDLERNHGLDEAIWEAAKGQVDSDLAERSCMDL